jgi:DNA topoisomerase-3
VFDQDVGQLYAAAVREAGSLRVTSITVKEDRKGRPAGLNTVELLKVASSALNIGPHHAMQVRGGGAGEGGGRGLRGGG